MKESHGQVQTSVVNCSDSQVLKKKQNNYWIKIRSLKRIFKQNILDHVRAVNLTMQRPGSCDDKTNIMHNIRLLIVATMCKILNAISQESIMITLKSIWVNLKKKIKNQSFCINNFINKRLITSGGKKITFVYHLMHNWTNFFSCNRKVPGN